MGIALFAYPNRTDEATLSDGSWAISLNKLKNRVYGDVARSTNLSTSSTKFQVNLGKSRGIRVISLCRHNFTTLATWRIRASNTSGDFSSPLYDSGWVNVYPASDSLSWEWEDDEFWFGTLSSEKREYWPALATTILPSDTLAQYWLIEMDDSTNPKGYVDIGRLFMCDAWQPAYNIAAGMSFGHETQTTVTSSKSGNKFFNYSPPYRVLSGQINSLSDDETYNKAFDLQRRQGIDKEVFFILDPDKTERLLQTAFPARLRVLTRIEYPNYDANNLPIEIEELL